MAEPADTHPDTPRRHRLIGVIVAAAALLAAAGGVIALLAVRNDEPAQTRRHADPDAELALLQEEFKSLIEQDLGDDRVAVLERKAFRFAQQHPAEVGGHVMLAQTRLKLGDHAGAYDAMARAVRIEPGNFEYQKLAGFCAAAARRYDDAEQHYRKAASLDSVFTVHLSLGHIYLEQGRLDQAEGAYNGALTGKNYGEDANWKHGAYAGLANVASSRGDYARAQELIDKALKWAANDSKADAVGYMIQKARLYLDAGEDADASAMLTHTWAQHPEAQWRLDSARLRARLYERAGDPQRAKNHVAGVTEYQLNDPDRDDEQAAAYVAELAAWQIKAGDIEGARVSIANLKTLSPNHPRLAELRERLATK